MPSGRTPSGNWRPGAAIAAGVICAALAAMPHASAQQEAGATQQATSVEGLPELASADAGAGEELYQSVCRNCHGPTAKGMASFPKLAGQDSEYLQSVLIDYRAGETLGFNTALMAPHAKALSDADIVNLVAYIATFE